MVCPNRKPRLNLTSDIFDFYVLWYESSRRRWPTWIFTTDGKSIDGDSLRCILHPERRLFDFKTSETRTSSFGNGDTCSYWGKSPWRRSYIYSTTEGKPSTLPTLLPTPVLFTDFIECQSRRPGDYCQVGESPEGVETLGFIGGGMYEIVLVKEIWWTAIDCIRTNK